MPQRTIVVAVSGDGIFACELEDLPGAAVPVTGDFLVMPGWRFRVLEVTRPFGSTDQGGQVLSGAQRLQELLYLMAPNELDGEAAVMWVIQAAHKLTYVGSHREPDAKPAAGGGLILAAPAAAGLSTSPLAFTIATPGRLSGEFDSVVMLRVHSEPRAKRTTLLDALGQRNFICAADGTLSLVEADPDGVGFKGSARTPDREGE